jgi:hypothetical protein
MTQRVTAIRDVLDHPVVVYLIISLASLGVAVICFKLGGSLAEVSGNQDSILGVGFKASGALGGFFLVFLLSQRAIGSFRRDTSILTKEASTLRVKVYLRGKPHNFNPAINYKCEAVLFNEETGERRTLQVTPRWEAGFLTLDFHGVLPVDYVGAIISDDRNQRWQLQDFKPLTHEKEISLV